VVTVALDSGGADAVQPWTEKANQTHPSVIDAGHVTDELFGFTNVPMAVWIDESGLLVRPAHTAQHHPSPMRAMEIPEGLPERLEDTLRQVQQIPDVGDRYPDMVRDWVARGEASEFAFDPDEVVARSTTRDSSQAEAAACFELGQHLWSLGEQDDAAGWWRRAHELDPENWTYKRQAWTLATTKPGEPSDLLQGPTDLYEGNWLDDIKALGPDRYYPAQPD